MPIAKFVREKERVNIILADLVTVDDELYVVHRCFREPDRAGGSKDFESCKGFCTGMEFEAPS